MFLVLHLLSSFVLLFNHTTWLQFSRNKLLSILPVVMSSIFSCNFSPTRFMIQFNITRYYIGVFAILKLGAAFVPLDTRAPVERSVDIIRDHCIRVLVCSTAHSGVLQKMDLEGIVPLLHSLVFLFICLQESRPLLCHVKTQMKNCLWLTFQCTRANRTTRVTISALRDLLANLKECSLLIGEYLNLCRIFFFFFFFFFDGHKMSNIIDWLNKKTPITVGEVAFTAFALHFDGFLLVFHALANGATLFMFDSTLLLGIHIPSRNIPKYHKIAC
jgi:hypothetical protein